MSHVPSILSIVDSLLAGGECEGALSEALHSSFLVFKRTCADVGGVGKQILGALDLQLAEVAFLPKPLECGLENVLEFGAACRALLLVYAECVADSIVELGAGAHRSLRKLVQSLIGTSFSPFLSRGVGVPLEKRIGSVSAAAELCQNHGVRTLTDSERHRILYTSVKAIWACIDKSEFLFKVVMRDHTLDVVAALIQLVYEDVENREIHSDGMGDANGVGVSGRATPASVASSGLNVVQLDTRKQIRLSCCDMLDDLHKRLRPAVVLETFVVLLGEYEEVSVLGLMERSVVGSCNRGPAPGWLSTICKRRLSDTLMRPGQLPFEVKNIRTNFDSKGVSPLCWNKQLAVFRISTPRD